VVPLRARDGGIWIRVGRAGDRSGRGSRQGVGAVRPRWRRQPTRVEVLDGCVRVVSASPWKAVDLIAEVGREAGWVPPSTKFWSRPSGSRDAAGAVSYRRRGRCRGCPPQLRDNKVVGGSEVLAAVERSGGVRRVMDERCELKVRS